MRIITDRRSLRVSLIICKNGEMEEEHLADVWQDMNGLVVSPSAKRDIVMDPSADILIQASEAFVSPIEWLRIRLSRCSNLKVKVSGN